MLTKLILIPLGRMFYFFEKLVSRSIGAYKTYLVKKNGSNPLWIGPTTSLKNTGNIYIGENSYVNGGALLAGNQSKIIIGDNCLISFDVQIRTYSHNYDNNELPIIEQGDFEKDITIGSNVWIGHGVVIMPGVRIGNDCIIGACAVVTKDVLDKSIVGGIPAKLLKPYL